MKYREIREEMQANSTKMMNEKPREGKEKISVHYLIKTVLRSKFKTESKIKFKKYKFILKHVIFKVKVKVKEFYCNKIINIHGTTQRLKPIWVYLHHTILASVTLQ